MQIRATIKGVASKDHFRALSLQVRSKFVHSNMQLFALFKIVIG